MSEITKSVPWDYQELAFGESWEWDTTHFNAKIQRDGGRYFWSVGDKTQGRLRSLDSGAESNHQNAENRIKELVGKSYPTKYGYRAYAGRLATTFRIYTGQEVDFFDMETTRVIVKVQMPKDEQKTLVGTLRVVHHKIHLTTEGNQTYAIEPAHIIEAQQEFGKYGTSQAVEQKVKVQKKRSENWLLGE